MILFIQNIYSSFKKVIWQLHIIFHFDEIIVNKNSPITSENKFKCLYSGCGNLFTSKQLLLNHLRTHFGVKPFICNFCSKSFNDRGNLKAHIRTHTGERPFKCSLCDKAFKTEGQLREHLKTHFKEKPFQCPHCHKFYKRKGVLKIHMLIHKDDPSFIQKKDIYEKMVNDLDNKNFSYIFDPQTNKSNNSNNLTINSTKEDSHINWKIYQLIKSDGMCPNEINNPKSTSLLSIKDKNFNMNDKNNTFKINTFNINQNEENQDDEDEKNKTVFQMDKTIKYNNTIRGDLFQTINEQEDKDEKSQYCLNEIKGENITNFPLLEEIMWVIFFVAL